MTAKMKSKPHRAQSREDWNFVRVAIMKWCLKVKLVQHWKAFSKLLLSTADLPIVEQSRRDRFWGAVAEPNGGVLDGANVLGRLLMDIRARLKENPSQFEIVSPVPIPNFLLLGRPIEPVRRESVLRDGIYQDLEGEEELEQHVVLRLR
jgi:NADAR domain